MPTRTHSIFFAALILCTAAAASAQTVYKTVDDEGRTTFTDRPAAKTSVAPRRGGKIDVNEAARRLKQARLERALGAAPRPGELHPGARERTVNYRYWQRQERLRRVVEQALRRSNETSRVQIAAG